MNCHPALKTTLSSSLLWQIVCRKLFTSHSLYYDDWMKSFCCSHTYRIAFFSLCCCCRCSYFIAFRINLICRSFPFMLRCVFAYSRDRRSPSEWRSLSYVDILYELRFHIASSSTVCHCLVCWCDGMLLLFAAAVNAHSDNETYRRRWWMRSTAYCLTETSHFNFISPINVSPTSIKVINCLSTLSRWCARDCARMLRLCVLCVAGALA